MKKLMIITPLAPEFEDVEATIKEAIQEVAINKNIDLEPIVSPDDGYASCDKYFSKPENVFSIIDISTGRPKCLYSLGFIDANHLPRLVIGAEPSFNDMGNIIKYERSRLTILKTQLIKAIENAIDNPDNFIRTDIPEKNIISKPSAFISYSHKDKESLERLKIHLKPLEKENLLGVWEDSKIKTGDKWKEKIEKALERAAIAVLLISPDFLASDFITDN